MEHANFEVDPRLATLLSETYRSTEHAIKELIDNAWDADAQNVRVRLPDPMTFDPIEVEDDGTGMVPAELRQEYLRIARDRQALKGDRTIGKHRIVKGKKGIGKFAGLVVADLMVLETRARGNCTRLTIPRAELQNAVVDLESVQLPLEIHDCETSEHGTKIALTQLHQNLTFPSSDRLKQMLVFEYGREDDFRIFVNESMVTVDDLPGETTREEAELPEVGKVSATFTVTDPKRRVRTPGIVVRVGGKIIGEPSFFGLDKEPDIPSAVLKRLYGEVEADGLSDDVTADWGAIIENSKGYQQMQEWLRAQVRTHLNATCQREMSLARARLQQEIDRQLQRLPEHRRRFAEMAIQRIMQRFYGEPEDRVRPIISVVLDALERDEYRVVLQKIYEASKSDVAGFAEALADFGLLELSLVAQQASGRIEFLDMLDSLISNPDATEAEVHRALASNLWVFGPEFALMASNQSLATVIERYAEEKFEGKRAPKRPDLLLISQMGVRYTLIEFKRPSHKIGRQDINQAESYRDDLASKFSPMEVRVIGGDHDRRMDLNPPANVQVASYAGLINRARSELEWLLSELASKPVANPSQHT
jgi:hypothetical protein